MGIYALPLARALTLPVQTVGKPLDPLTVAAFNFPRLKTPPAAKAAARPAQPFALSSRPAAKPAVADGNARGAISSSLAKQLTSSLQTAADALAAGNSARAKTALTTFVGQVQGASSKAIDAAYAALLLSWANDLYARV
ncbi:MAG TPA: hypothetical protein VIU86_00325 [Gaiellaceae bacterium]